MARYTAVLDACVLVPIALADTLLRMAERGLYRPLWSQRILEETLAPRIVLEVIREQAAHTSRPSLTPTDLIARLARCGVPYGSIAAIRVGSSTSPG